MQNAVYTLRMPRATAAPAPSSARPTAAPTIRRPSSAPRCSTPLQIRSSEDAFVDELFAAAPAAGAPLLAARVPRACIDLNRAPDDLDPALIAGASPPLPQRPHRRRPRRDPARRRRGPADHAGQAHPRRGAAADRRLLASLPRPPARAARRGARRASAWRSSIDCHSMPHDALNAAPAVWGRPPERDPRRPLRRRLRPLADRRRHRPLRRRGLRRRPQRALRRRLHHPDLRPAPRRACRRCRSRSTARSTWTRPRIERLPGLRRGRRAASAASPPASPPSARGLAALPVAAE